MVYTCFIPEIRLKIERLEKDKNEILVHALQNLILWQLFHLPHPRIDPLSDIHQKRKENEVIDPIINYKSLNPESFLLHTVYFKNELILIYVLSRTSLQGNILPLLLHSFWREILFLKSCSTFMLDYFTRFLWIYFLVWFFIYFNQSFSIMNILSPLHNLTFKLN